MDVKPIGNRLLIRPIEEELSASGIIVVTANKDKAMQAEVLAVGHGEFGTDDPSQKFKVGDRILCARYAGDELRTKNDDGKFEILKIIMADTIHGIVN